MNKRFWGVCIVIFLGSLLLGWILYTLQPHSTYTSAFPILPHIPIISTPTPTLTPTPTPMPLPVSKTIPGGYHTFQTFNNCGPASLSMTLSLYGITVTQRELGQRIRPYQIPGGDNDDKSVTLPELGEYAKQYGLIPYHRPVGTIEILRKFISIDIPVLTRTLTHTYEDIGHFRIVKGYDDTKGVIIQDDSLQGANTSYTYDEFNALWQQFGYEYLVLVPQDKQAMAEQILGPDLDSKHAWAKARDLATTQSNQQPENIYAPFNLSVAYYHLGEYAKSNEAFSSVETRLPMRTLWYQTEPLQALFELQEDTRLLAIIETILSGGNRAYSELYILRGDIYKRQNLLDQAKAEYEKAVFYNEHLLLAKERLDSLTAL